MLRLRPLTLGWIAAASISSAANSRSAMAQRHSSSSPVSRDSIYLDVIRATVSIAATEWQASTLPDERTGRRRDVVVHSSDSTTRVEFLRPELPSCVGAATLFDGYVTGNRLVTRSERSDFAPPNWEPWQYNFHTNIPWAEICASTPTGPVLATISLPLDGSSTEGVRGLLLAVGDAVGARRTYVAPEKSQSEPLYFESEVVEKPEPLSGPPLQYPELLRQARMQGSVLVEAIIDTLGRAEPSSIRIVRSSHPGFDQHAKTYVRQALFRPARGYGRPVRVLVRLPVDFALQGR